MLYENTLISRALNTLLGTAIFVLIVAAGTYYLQSSLILVQQYDSYIHWAVVLLGLPLIAGIINRLLNITSPLFSSLFGALATAGLLYPQYQSWWAEPPTMADMAIYVVIILGIGFISTQPLKTTFMMAFRMNPRQSTGAKKPASKTGASKQPARRAEVRKVQYQEVNIRGRMVALVELVVGFTSLVLSVYSIFFLGQG